MSMASVSSQPQFRYTQPPSKVLHLRNLPWECTEEELIELGKPFGKVVNTKCNVGANRNQAFIEFVSKIYIFAWEFYLFIYFCSGLEFLKCEIFWDLSFRQIWTKLLLWYRTMPRPLSQPRSEEKQCTCSIPIGRKSWTTKPPRMWRGMCFWWRLKVRTLALSASMFCTW